MYIAEQSNLYKNIFSHSILEYLSFANWIDFK